VQNSVLLVNHIRTVRSMPMISHTISDAPGLEIVSDFFHIHGQNWVLFIDPFSLYLETDNGTGYLSREFQLFCMQAMGDSMDRMQIFCISINDTFIKSSLGAESVFPMANLDVAPVQRSKFV
jgi:hypothetical protein